jgi:ubiquinone/menaquinone biosynthesis C-methylase UbiE
VGSMSSEHYRKGDRSFSAEVDLPAAVYVGQLWAYSLSVLFPARAAKRAGMFVKTSVGKHPIVAQSEGQGQFYCREHRAPVLLDNKPSNHETVMEFDRGAEVYETAVAPFTRPVGDEAFVLIRRLIPRRARILDLGCGPGSESIRLAGLVPDGEVVGVDLSAEMVALAHRNAQQQKVLNTSFFQADVAELPDHFAARFDAIHCAFAFHHYREPLAALREMYRALTSEGKAFIIDGGTWWANAISTPFAKWADPGWVRFYTGEEFQTLFRSAGFRDFYWEEILPGIGISVGTK